MTKTYTLEAHCPLCGKDATLQLTARELKKLEASPEDVNKELTGRTQDKLEGRPARKELEGRAPQVQLTCDSCGKQHVEDLSNTCAEWDDYCNEVHPIQDV